MSTINVDKSQPLNPPLARRFERYMEPPTTLSLCRRGVRGVTTPSLPVRAQRKVSTSVMTDLLPDPPTSTSLLAVYVAGLQLESASPRLETSHGVTTPSLPVCAQRKVSTSVMTDHRPDPPTSTPTLAAIVAGSQLETTSPRLECSLASTPSPSFDFPATMARDGRFPTTSTPTHQPPDPRSRPSSPPINKRDLLAYPGMKFVHKLQGEGHSLASILDALNELMATTEVEELLVSLLARRNDLDASRILDPSRDSCELSVGSVRSSKVMEGGNAHLELALDCLGGEFTLPGAGEASPRRLLFGDTFLSPPPSYWIGLGRPPPAPNWQHFADDLGRRRPPPKPNWRAFHRQSPSTSRRTQVSKLPTSPPIPTTGPHTVLPLLHLLVVSLRLKFAQNYHVLLPFLLEAYKLLIRRGSVLSFLGFVLWKSFGIQSFVLSGNNILLWVYRLSIPLAFPWSFDTRILCHKDPSGPIGFLVHNLLSLHWIFSDGIPFGVNQQYPFPFPMFFQYEPRLFLHNSELFGFPLRFTDSQFVEEWGGYRI
jgi:hypothetical protein